MDKTSQLASWTSVPERILGFSAEISDDYSESNDNPVAMYTKRARFDRDRSTHRAIEKRRRDRMNSCLADLSRLIPASYTKQRQGRIEKTEVIEMAIRHIRNLDAAVEAANRGVKVKLEHLQPSTSGFLDCWDVVSSFLSRRIGSCITDTLMDELSRSIDKTALDLETANTMSEVNEEKRRTGYVGAAPGMSGVTMTSAGDGSPEDAICRRGSSFSQHRDVKKPGRSLPPSPSGEPQSPDSNCANAAYKFKNEIQLRFSADLDPLTSPSSCDDVRRRDGLTCDDVRRTDDLPVGLGTCDDVRRSDDLSAGLRTRGDVRRSDCVPTGLGSAARALHDSSCTRMDSQTIPNIGLACKPYVIAQSARDVSDHHRHRYDGRDGGGAEQREPNSANSNVCDRYSQPGANGDASETERDQKRALPGFVMHPSGVFYVPVTLPQTNVMTDAMYNMDTRIMCHQVSISVRFDTSPRLMM